MYDGEGHHELHTAVTIVRRRLTEYEEQLFLSSSRPLLIWCQNEGLHGHLQE